MSRTRRRKLLLVLFVMAIVASLGWGAWRLAPISNARDEVAVTSQSVGGLRHEDGELRQGDATPSSGPSVVNDDEGSVRSVHGVTTGHGYRIHHPFHIGSVADRYRQWMSQVAGRGTSVAPPHVSYVFWQDDQDELGGGFGGDERSGGRSRRGGRGRGRDPWDEYGGGFGGDDRRGVPRWDMNNQFEYDVFRFVRLQYSSWGGRRYHRLGRWATDYPDSDLNFSFRLQQLTAIQVNPDPLYVQITDEQLFDYPFVYMIEPGALYFDDVEVAALRKYLMNGGFLMVDDFWGSREYDNFYSEIKRVFPEREPEELPLSHPIFHYVYDLKEKPQVPSIHHWQGWGDSSERGYDSEEVHYKAITDDEDRIMVLICHNTDLGDGWEREGESREYFQLFSEKRAYPMGINIVLYAMTH